MEFFKEVFNQQNTYGPTPNRKVDDDPPSPIPRPNSNFKLVHVKKSAVRSDGREGRCVEQIVARQKPKVTKVIKFRRVSPENITPAKGVEFPIGNKKCIFEARKTSVPNK